MTKTTTNLQLPSPRDWRDLPVPVAIAICIFALLAIAGLVGRLRSDISAAAVPTPQLPIIIATSPAIVPPTAAPIQVAAVLPHFVVCYDQPAGSVLGPIPAPDASAIVARYGSTWVMTPWNGGYCWLRAADVGLPDVADLQPAEPPAVIYVAVEAAPTPAAPVPTMVEVQPVVWATAPAVIRKEDFTQPDPRARCQFIGCL